MRQIDGGTVEQHLKLLVATVWIVVINPFRVRGRRRGACSPCGLSRLSAKGQAAGLGVITRVVATLADTIPSPAGASGSIRYPEPVWAGRWPPW